MTNSSFGSGGSAGLPGRADFSDPRFMFMGVCRNSPFPSIFEHAALHAHGARRGAVGAVDVSILPTDSITYPDGQKALPLALLVGDGTLLGAWSGRLTADSDLVLADWLLPYFVSDANNPNGFGQETYYYAIAADPRTGHFRPSKKLMSCLMEWTQLASEVSADVRRGQPIHPIYTMMRPAPIVTYTGIAASSKHAQPADPSAATAGPMDEEFARRNADLIAECRPFYITEAATNAGVSTAMARFLLRRMDARGEVSSSERFSATPVGTP